MKHNISKMLLGAGLCYYEQGQLENVQNLSDDLAGNAMERIFLNTILAVETEGKQKAIEVYYTLKNQKIAYAERTIALDLLFLLGEDERAQVASQQIVREGCVPESWPWWEYRLAGAHAI